jgi:protein-S-isoprenylcysteine O-methyltransferase Ste14
MTLRGATLVAVQSICGIALVCTGPVLNKSWPSALVVAAFALLIWAIISLRSHTLTALPEVRQGAEMTTAGPYRWIRHPMYSAVLLLTVAWVLMNFTWWRVLIWLVLAANLTIKMFYEESLLSAHYPAYADYKRKTWRLVPFLFLA